MWLLGPTKISSSSPDFLLSPPRLSHRVLASGLHSPRHGLLTLSQAVSLPVVCFLLISPRNTLPSQGAGQLPPHFSLRPENSQTSQNDTFTAAGIFIMKQGKSPSPFGCRFCREPLSPVPFFASDWFRAIAMVRPYRCPHCFQCFFRPFAFLMKVPLVGPALNSVLKCFGLCPRLKGPQQG